MKDDPPDVNVQSSERLRALTPSPYSPILTRHSYSPTLTRPQCGGAFPAAGTQLRAPTIRSAPTLTRHTYSPTLTRILTRHIASFLAICTFLPLLLLPQTSAAEPAKCTLGIPSAPILRVTSSVETNAWLTANDAYPVMALCGIASNSVAIMEPEMIGQSPARLAAAESGFVIERSKPQYWLADQIEAPDGVDWDATYSLFSSSSSNPESFFFNTAAPALYAANGGMANFTWVFTDGQTQEQVYIIGGAAQGRPHRIFWTDWPYDAPTIDLSGKFVKFFGSPNILTPYYGVTTNIAGGIAQVVTNKITRGLYLDPATKQLFAAGEISGQVLMVYYDSGLYTTPLMMQVVEVAQPKVIPMSGRIGSPLQPNGGGYQTDGLTALPTMVQESDNRGPYLYQHSGNYSYSPKHGNVYPLRPTMGERWNAEVYWMETDGMQVQWPFELCQYECDWPESAPAFVRGTLKGSDGATDYGCPIYIPGAYTATLMGFQEPEGHARAVEPDGTFSTRSAGWSLLRLTGDDNVWFLPIRSVLRDDPSYFTLAASDLEVGLEAQMRGGSISGTAPGWQAPEVDSSIPGYLYRAASGTSYNPNLYRDTVSYESSGEAGTTDVAPSAIFPVTVDGKPLEVWWSRKFLDDQMSVAISIPTLPQVYNPVWPQPAQVPQIILASQQGSANETIYEKDGAMVFDSTEASMQLPRRAYFTQESASIHFWTRPCDSADTYAQLLNLAGGGTPPFSLSIAAAYRPDSPASESYHLTLAGWKADGTATNVVLEATRAVADPFTWVSVGLSRQGTTFRLYFDGELALERDIPAYAVSDFDASLTTGTIGATATATTLPKREIAEITFWNRVFSAGEFYSLAYRRPTASEPGLTGRFAFEDGRDLKVVSGSNLRTAYERLHDHPCVCRDVLLRTPGAPAIGQGIIEADETPLIYNQPYPAAIGYNPNEEHAFIRGGSGGYVAWALRCDLNTATSSEPGVLVQYTLNGRSRMQYFAVILTNSVYPELAADCVAGQQLPGPHPLDLLDDPWLSETYWTLAAGETEPVAFRDRKKQLWARCAGTLPIHMYYPMQEGFWFPTLAADKQPAVGSAIPWLSQLNGQTPNPNSEAPTRWTWHSLWPQEVPEMAIGQTLTVAAGGLPEVWNAKSMGVVYPDPTKESATVRLYDPTVAQAVALDAALLAELGLQTGPNEKLLSRKGKYWFQDIAPAISSRVYVDPAAAQLVCIGVKEDNAGGVELLHVNVLSDDERQMLLDLVDPTLRNGSAWTAWRAAVNALATVPVTPVTAHYENNTDLKLVYIPTDHYALSAMGATNYVVLIENDADNQETGVKAGDPISMQVLRVVPRYFTGRIVTREDQQNLLSQQLSILYSESFAGHADAYVFQWKKATPNANGTIPTDYDNTFQARFPDTAGLIRFVIGAQGDTLANMVNTYYIMRYRAAGPETPAYAVMGDTWSDWCAPPALAEGWVQRVLNNITPFTQRMQDLYENEVEDAVSMIQQAGAPYEGDVALNQDNLTSVGLIQLYQTILNKAETMSLLQRANDADANKQLLLAVQRLADLYTVLGDEAYTDAMNPTIGIGANYGVIEGGLGLGYDYGALASGLFCFDNQLPSLLDEELALLRGRSGANAPGTTIGPYYNRLIWNFTRGITAGEVAYAVNYNISGEKTATIDYQQAATAFPQGHGDAYGHYLSALSGYYRLLRNPYFSWGVPAMGEMVVADNVVNVDYYDESTFAKAAANVARAAVDIVDRTARKAWRDSGAGSGYLDSDAERGFGYGEWASRGGYGALCNWVVANSLLPESGGITNTYAIQFTGASSALIGTLPSGATSTNTAAGWTLELQLQSDSDAAADSSLLLWHQKETGQMFLVKLGADGTVSVSLQQSVEEIVFEDGNPVTNYIDVVVWSGDTAPAKLEPGQPYLLAVSQSAGVAALDLRIFNRAGIKVAACSLDISAAPLAFSGGSVAVGYGYSGIMANFRFWSKELSDEALVAGWYGVNPESPGLVSSLSMTGASDDDAILIDEVSLLEWSPYNLFWRVVDTGTMQSDFNDLGLLRIDRDTVTGLSEIAESLNQIQTKTDAADLGLNPLGLAEGAIPFDLSPLGSGESGTTHYEQIRDRALVALRNASTILQEAQENGSRLRQIEDARTGYVNQLDTMEKSYKDELITLFGYPFSGDIGPSGTYIQGYDGPDLIHYMWMDMEPYGLTEIEDTQVVTNKLYQLSTSVKQNVKVDDKYINLWLNATNTVGGETIYSMAYSASGLVQKPAKVSGTRRAPGEIQQAYGNFLQSYARVKRALYLYGQRTSELETNIKFNSAMYGLADYKAKIYDSIALFDSGLASDRQAFKTVLASLNLAITLRDFIESGITDAFPKVLGVGTTFVSDPSSISKTASLPASIASQIAFQSAKTASEIVLITDSDEWKYKERYLQALAKADDYAAGMTQAYEALQTAFHAQVAAGDELESAWGAMLAAQAAYEVVVAKGQRLLESRELERQQVSVALTKLRYHDMLFRQIRNESLTRYSAAFDLAQKYVHLAAKAYDFETGLLASDPEAGDAFINQTIGARSIGVMDANGNPVVGGGTGDPGLADIMARMDANWLVLKSRLGINNPQPYATWFSLRHELFRILPGDEGAAAWQTELAKYRVDDLLSLSEYKRFCQPFQAVGGLQAREPGLVIPFSTTIDFAKNFFGNDLAGEDSALDSTYFATKIAAAGVYLDGYNVRVSSYNGTAPFALTPTVYLIPIGDDRMRAPGLEDGTVLSYRIVDQVVPLPYTVGSSHLNDPDWLPLYDGYTGGVDLGARIRKYPSFRAYFGGNGPMETHLDCPRLVGRSAWNTRWLLIIPAGTLNANRDDALKTFINGKDANRDGKIDFSGITDIRLGLKTYSHSGN